MLELVEKYPTIIFCHRFANNGRNPAKRKYAYLDSNDPDKKVDYPRKLDL
jgi:hypothetical protein